MRLPEPKALHRYLAVVALPGLLLLAAVLSSDRLGRTAGHMELFLLLAALVVIGELFPIKVPRRDAEITTSTAYAFALLISFGTAAAVVAVLASTAIDLFRRRSLWRAAFNVGQFTLSFAASGAVLALLSGVPRATDPPFAPVDLPGIFAAGAVFFIFNNTLAGVASALAVDEPLREHLREDLVFQASTAAVLLGLSPVALVAADFSLWMLPLLTLPLVAVYLGGWQAALNDHQALHDGLTGLPNRALFHERAEHALRARGDDEMVAVMIMDLDGFKQINDTLGHHAGDLLLQAIAPRLRAAVRDHGSVARLGGDEFALLLPRIHSAAEAEEWARTVLRSFEESFSLDTMTITVRASVGIACGPDSGADVDTLMQRADSAMYVAKRGKVGHSLYAKGSDTASARRTGGASGLARAIENGELEAYFQPQVALASGTVVGVEALVRWQHPDQGRIGPDDFITLAEQTGLMKPLTMAVAEQSLQACRRWHDDGLELSVSINLSVQSLLDRTFPGDVAALLERTGVSGTSLMFEVTESTVLADPGAIGTLEELRKLGIGISIDDFGTGYSSLAYLKTLPVNEVKIDRSFVFGMGTDERDAKIVQSTIDLAQTLGLQAVAEGVEDEASWNRLRSFGCDLVQGFLIAPALSADDLVAWLQAPMAGSQRLLAPRAGDMQPVRLASV